MARKGNRNKGIADSEPDLATVDSVEESINGKMSGTQLDDRVNKTHHLANDKKSKQKSRKPLVKQDKDTTRMEDPQISCNKAAGNYNKVTAENVKSTRGCNLDSANNGHGQPLNGSHRDGVAETIEFSSAMLAEFLNTAALTISKAYCKSIERLAPLLSSLATMLRVCSDYAWGKILIASPILFRLIKQFGTIGLLLMVVWLDCVLRGCESILLMGTALLFSIIWCSFFSIVAMIGMFKFLLFAAAAAIVGRFIGFAIALILISISMFGLVWFYGSFWTTTLVAFLGGLSFLLKREQLGLLLFALYSVYSAWFYLGWLSVIVALNLAFISNDIFAYYARNLEDTRTPPEQADQMHNQPGFFPGEPVHASFAEPDYGLAADRSSGMPSTSGSESGMTSEEEVARLLKCSDHYSALGLPRFGNVDISILKREYRKKAMLVHPDKNMGNEKAAEAFKKLQNAYEVLLDSFKRKAYDTELRSEDLLNYLKRFKNTSQKKNSHGFFTSEDDGEMHEESRRISCRKCGNSHVWIYTNKLKSKARWCQDCKDHHPAKDGDGWVEQSTQPFLFGTMQKVMAPAAFVCADSRIYNATEWYMCQGMRCPVNTHKASFHVNTSVTMKQNNGKGFNAGQRNGAPPTPPFGETMTEEEFFEWVQNTVQSGGFENFPGSTSETPTNGGNTPKGSGSGNSKKKKKGKKQW